MATTKDPDTGFAQVLITCLCSHKAELLCTTCKINLCRLCVGTHILSLPPQDHNVVIYSLKSETILQPYCDYHTDQRCVLYCQDCDVPVCNICIVSQRHIRHKFGENIETFNLTVDTLVKETQILEEVIAPRCNKNIAEIEQDIMEHQNREDRSLVESDVTENEDMINRRKILLEYQGLLDYVHETIQKNKELVQNKYSETIANLKSLLGVAGKIKKRLDSLEKLGLEMKKFTNVYIKNFNDDVNDEELRKMFEPFGEISSATVMRDRISGKSKGYGFVNFKDPEAAEKAVYAMHGEIIRGKALYAGRAKTKIQRQAEYKELRPIRIDENYENQRVNVFIKNLDLNIDDERLQNEFEKFGTITSAKVMTEGGRSKGFGFVCFSSPEEATKAVTKMNGRIVVAKPLYVALAQKKEDREAHLASQYMQRITSMRMQGQQIKHEENIFHPWDDE